MLDHRSEERFRIAFYVLLITTTAFRLLYIRWVELAPDEAYYWTWSQNLQWGYYDHPPMVGLLIRIFTGIGGRGEFGVRWGWVLIGALTCFLLYRMALKMFGSERAGFLSALLAIIVPLLATGAVIATPDGPQALFWVLAIFSVFLATETRARHWWYLAGLSLGLGLMSKYTMILLVPCIFLFLLSSAEGRKWLLRKEPYLALLMGLLIFSPVILWNAQHKWISFRFQFSHGLKVKEAAGLKYFAGYWAGQAGLVSPFVFLALIWAMARSMIEGLRRQKTSLLLLFSTSAPLLLFFAYTSLRSKVEANWPALAYLTAVVALAGITSEEWPGWTKARKGVARVAVLTALLLTSAAYLQTLYALVPIPAEKDPTSRLCGWRILGERIEEAARSVPPGKEIFLLSPSHQLLAEGMFYTGGKFPAYQRRGHWRINHLSPDNAPPIGSRAIFLAEEGNKPPKVPASLFGCCQKWETLAVKRNSSTIRRIQIWRCFDFKGSSGFHSTHGKRIAGIKAAPTLAIR